MSGGGARVQPARVKGVPGESPGEIAGRHYLQVRDMKENVKGFLRFLSAQTQHRPCHKVDGGSRFCFKDILLSRVNVRGLQQARRGS